MLESFFNKVAGLHIEMNFNENSKKEFCFCFLVYEKKLESWFSGQVGKTVLWNMETVSCFLNQDVYSNPDFLHILICPTRGEHCIARSNFFTYWLHFCMYQLLHLQGFGYFVWIYISKCKRFFLFRMQFGFENNLKTWDIAKFHTHKNVFVWEKAAKTSFVIINCWLFSKRFSPRSEIIMVIELANMNSDTAYLTFCIKLIELDAFHLYVFSECL